MTDTGREDIDASLINKRTETVGMVLTKRVERCEGMLVCVVAVEARPTG